MKIKNIFMGVALMLLSSCNFLDIVPDDRPSFSDAFKNEATSEGFLYSCYGFLPDFTNFRANFTWYTSNEVVNSYHWADKWFSYARMQRINYSASEPVIDIWRQSYEGIRQCFLFLDNIDNAVAVNISEAQFAERKTRWIAEVKFLKAYYHFILLQNYGPIVILDKMIDINGSGDEYFKHRLPYDECVDNIAQMFDEALAGDGLPLTITSKAEYGRITKVIAQSMKAKMYLFAASKLYNGNDHPLYQDFKGPDGIQLINTSYNKEKWNTVMVETEKAINLAEKAGHALYKYQGKVADDFDQAVKTAQWTMVDPWNSELIFGYTGVKESNNGNSVQRHIIPRGWNRSGTPHGGIAATIVPVEMFYTQDGVPAETTSKYYNWDDRFTIADGDSTILLNRHREPRFYASVGFDRGSYEISDEVRTLYLRKGEKNSHGNPQGVDHLYSGYAIKKGVHPSTLVTADQFVIKSYPFPLLRLGELYLNYAEAYAEYHGNLAGDGLMYFDAIREKAGISKFTAAFGNKTGEELIEIIRRERMIEFAFEGHLLYDLKRWLIADEFFKGPKCYGGQESGMWGLNSLASTAEEFYKLTRLTQQPFRFDPKQYLSPIKQTYIDVNHNLEQNPGW